MNTRNFFAELKRFNVYQVAVAYALLAWLHVQGATEVVFRIRHSELAVRFVVLLLILGFPAALVLSWVFETRQKESALGSCCA